MDTFRSTHQKTSENRRKVMNQHNYVISFVDINWKITHLLGKTKQNSNYFIYDLTEQLLYFILVLVCQKTTVKNAQKFEKKLKNFSSVQFN